MYLKFVDRSDRVPHRSLMIQCDTFYKEWVRLQVGENMEKYSPSIADTAFPFEDDSRWEASKEDTNVLIVSVAGTPGFHYIAGRNVILFVMNDDGRTIDKTVV